MATEAQPATIPLLGRVRGLGVVPLLGFTLIAFLLFWVVINFYKFPADSTQVLLIGLTTGAIYALVALGYTLVYGILELINFAHGDVFMLGGMISATFAVQVFGLGVGGGAGKWLLVLATLLISMGLCGLINTTVEIIAYRPLRGAPRLVPLITAIGMSFILQNVGLAWKGPNFISVPNILRRSNVFEIRGGNSTW